MNIASEQHLAATVLRITGELTAEESDNFKRNTLEATNTFSTDIVFDCSSLTLIDSIGLESLLWLSDEVEGHGHRLRLANVPDHIANIFRFTRLDGAFSSHDTVEAAARSLNT